MSWYVASTVQRYIEQYIFINNSNDYPNNQIIFNTTNIPNLSAYKYLDYIIVGGGGGGGGGNNAPGSSNFGGGGGGSGYMTSTFGSGESGLIDNTNNFKYLFGIETGGSGGLPLIIQPNLSSIVITIGAGGNAGPNQGNGNPGGTTSIQYSLSGGASQTLATANGGQAGTAGVGASAGNGGGGYCGGGGGSGGSVTGSGGTAQSNPGYNGNPDIPGLFPNPGNVAGAGGGFVVTESPFPLTITGGGGGTSGGTYDSGGGGGGGGSGVLYLNSFSPFPIPNGYQTIPNTAYCNIGGWGGQSTDSSGSGPGANGVAFTGAGGGGGSYKDGTYQIPGAGGCGYAILWFHN